jgi:hypothetical protein
MGGASKAQRRISCDYCAGMGIHGPFHILMHYTKYFFGIKLSGLQKNGISRCSNNSKYKFAQEQAFLHNLNIKEFS